MEGKGKEISLNFKAKSDADIKEIAAATVGDTAINMQRQRLLDQVKRMETDYVAFSGTLQAGSFCLQQFHEYMGHIHNTVSDLDASRQQSLLNTLLGYRVLSQQKIDGVAAAMSDCERYSQTLEAQAVKLGGKLREKQALDEVAYGDMDQDAGQSGLYIQQRMHALRVKSAEQERQTGSLIQEFGSVSKQFAVLHDRGRLVVRRQQARLTGAKP